ncbi:MAG: hypothetical protein M1839_002466 [Geoglossum umbratile]|nr:MAG: hypothetical protein M1839_002466 [Geoglossum umbratile]
MTSLKETSNQEPHPAGLIEEPVQRYGIPGPPDANGRYFCFAIAVKTYETSPSYCRLKALCVQDRPIQVDIHPFYMGYQMKLFGRLPAIGEVVKFNHCGMTIDIPPRFMFAKCTELITNPYPEKWVIPKGKEYNSLTRKRKQKVYKSADYIPPSDGEEEKD